MIRKRPPAAFSNMCSAFHQDAAVLMGASLEDQAKDCIEFVPQELRADLASFLEGLLDRRDNGELRRILRKQERVDLAMSRAAWWALFELIHAKLAANAAC